MSLWKNVRLVLLLLHLLRHCSTTTAPVGGVPEAGSSSSSSSCPSPLQDVGGDDEDVCHQNPAMEALQDVAKLIENSQTILVVTGAGVSVAAGIPDFRTPEIGLYDNLEKYNLPYPEAVFDLQYYRQNPQPFVALIRDMYPAMTTAQPTLTHHFLKALNDHNKLLRVYTQNIDGLDRRAGTPAEKIIECHGHFRTASCSVCGKEAPIDSVLNTMIQDGQVPLCEACGNPVKPDITFFGQEMPSVFFDSIERDTDEADLLLVLGTSLNVVPVSLIPNFVDPDIPRVLLNRERVDMGIRKDKKDIFIEGDCDANAEILVQLLGWKDEILQSQENFRIQNKAEQIDKE